MGLKVYSAIDRGGATEPRAIGQELARLVEYQTELQKEIARVNGVASAPETDPVFGASPAGGITAEDIAAWDAASGESHDAVTLDTPADTLLSLTGQVIGLDTTAANKVFAGPATGAAAAPAMRDLVDADFPATIARDTEVSGAISTHAAIAAAHHTNANDPSAGEKAALGGTSGTPGAENKYVTNGDSRNTDARTPAAHVLVSASHTASGLTAGHFVKALTETTFGFAAHGLTYSDVGALAVAGTAADSDKVDGSHANAFAAASHAHAPGDVTGTAVVTNDARLSDARSPTAHALTNSVHAETGLTTGHFLKATSATAFGFGAHGLTASDVGALAVAGTAADSDKVDGNHASAFLGASATAADSDKLDGSHASAFAAASHGHGIGDLPTAAVGDGDTTHVPTCDGVYDAIAGMGGHAAVTLDANADTLLSLSTQALGLDTQTANKLFGGPASGAAAVPTFRDLVNADIPATTITAGKLSATATKILFGRSTAGAGPGEEIACAAVTDGATTIPTGNDVFDFCETTKDYVQKNELLQTNLNGYRDLCSFFVAGNSTGAMVITMPKGWSITTMSARLRGYKFDVAYGPWELLFGGTNHTTGPAWASVRGAILGRAPFTRVRAGYDAALSKCVLILGETTTAWYYATSAALVEFLAGNAATTGWETGWTMAITNDISAYSSVVEVPVSCQENWDAGFALVAQKAAANGIATLDANSKVVQNPATAYLPLAGGTMAGTLAMGANAITSSGTISSGVHSATGLKVQVPSVGPGEAGYPALISTVSSVMGAGSDISLQYFQAAIQTTDATETTLVTIPVPDQCVINIHAVVNAIKTADKSIGAGYEIIGTYFNTSGTAHLIGSLSPLHTAETDSTWIATLTVSGTNVLVRVTGKAGTEINWICTATRHAAYVIPA